MLIQIVNLGHTILNRVADSNGDGSPDLGLLGLLGIAWSLVVIIPTVAVGVRRLHDINRTGWWLFLIFVPVIGWVVLIVWAIKRGDKGPNKYGPDPRQATSQ